MDQSNKNPDNFNEIQINYNQPFDSVVQDPSGYDFFVAHNGIVFHHWACVPDPIGEVEIADARDSYQVTDNNQFDIKNKFYKENGFIYFYKGQVIGIFQGNTNKLNQTYAGFYTSSGATVTFNKYYKDSTEVVAMSEFDKLIPCDLDSELASVNWEKFKFNNSGKNRTRFYIKDVEVLVDSFGVFYYEGTDFVVCDGDIKWVNGGNWPGIDPKTGEGKVCSIRYTYKPYFYVKQFMHDIRVRPEIDPNTGEIKVKSSNIAAQLVADFVLLDQRTRDDSNKVQQIMHGNGANQGPR